MATVQLWDPDGLLVAKLDVPFADPPSDRYRLGLALGAASLAFDIGTQVGGASVGLACGLAATAWALYGDLPS